LREDYLKICGSSNPRVVNDEDLFQDALDHEPPEEEIKVGEVIIAEQQISSNHSSEEEVRALKQAREEEVRRKIKEMILNRLSEEDLAKVLDEH
jgi:hypothetical protein